MPSRWSRRDVLGLSGAGIALLAGCTNTSPDSGSTATTETVEESTEPYDTTEPRTTTETYDVSIEEVDVTPEIVAPNTPDSIGVYGERDEQFVVVQYLTDGETKPDWSDFSLVAEGDAYEPEDPERTYYGYSLWDDEGYVNSTEGYLIFSLPKPLDADEATIRWPGGERALSKRAVERLARPPTDFTVREFSAPEVVEIGEEVTLTVVVENTGDVDGTFVGALNRIGPDVAYTPVKAVSLEIEADESATWTHSYTPPFGHEGPSMRFSMDWRGGGQSREIAIGSDSPTGTTAE